MGSALSEAENANARASTLLRQKFYTSRRVATSASPMLTALLPWYLWTVGLFVQETMFVKPALLGIRQAHPWRLHPLEQQSPIGNSYRIRRHKCGSRNDNWQAKERIETHPGTSLTCGSGLMLGSAFLKRGRCRSPACLMLTYLPYLVGFRARGFTQC